jgi:hypothetical protein
VVWSKFKPFRPAPATAVLALNFDACPSPAFGSLAGGLTAEARGGRASASEVN